MTMWHLNTICLIILTTYVMCIKDKDIVLYYYGLEESERSLPECQEQQACSVLAERYWRPSALVRLCRCPRRLECSTSDLGDRAIELNNRAQFKFCKPITNWSECPPYPESMAVTVVSDTQEMDPDVLEDLHHENIQLRPPKIIFNCRCPYPNYWKVGDNNENIQQYKCATLPLCKTNEFCGNINYNFNALYQSCLCPKHHICVHRGGLNYVNITEILYHGKGTRAYCQRLNSADSSYEDY